LKREPTGIGSSGFTTLSPWMISFRVFFFLCDPARLLEGDAGVLLSSVFLSSLLPLKTGRFFSP